MFQQLDLFLALVVIWLTLTCTGTGSGCSLLSCSMELSECARLVETVGAGKDRRRACLRLGGRRCRVAGAGCWRLLRISGF